MRSCASIRFLQVGPKPKQTVHFWLTRNIFQQYITYIEVHTFEKTSISVPHWLWVHNNCKITWIPIEHQSICTEKWYFLIYIRVLFATRPFFLTTKFIKYLLSHLITDFSSSATFFSWMCNIILSSSKQILYLHLKYINLLFSQL